jgi:hypothetical protein
VSIITIPKGARRKKRDMTREKTSGVKRYAVVRILIGVKIEAVKRNELHKFEVFPKRRVVGCTFGWGLPSARHRIFPPHGKYAAFRC